MELRILKYQAGSSPKPSKPERVYPTPCLFLCAFVVLRICDKTFGNRQKRIIAYPEAVICQQIAALKAISLSIMTVPILVVL